MYNNKKLDSKLIEYILLVGPSEQDSHTTCELIPIILSKYPTIDRPYFELPKNAALFCQPDGCKVIKVSSYESWKNEAYSFAFTLTDKDTCQVSYGLCYNFYMLKTISDSVNDNTNQLLEMNSVCIISRLPFIEKFRLCIDFILRYAFNNHEEDINNSIQSSAYIWKILTNQSFSDKIHLEYIKNISRVHKKVKSLRKLFNDLTNIQSINCGQESIRLELSSSRSFLELEFALPNKSRLPMMDFPVHMPLEVLGIELSLQVFKCILFEQKIIFVSQNYNLLSTCILALVALLYPLDYMFPVIPILPACMTGAEQLLSAPTPFVIGLPVGFFEKRIDTDEIPMDVWVVNLDSAILTQPRGNLVDDGQCSYDLPEFPQDAFTQLTRKLNNLLFGELNSADIINGSKSLGADYILHKTGSLLSTKKKIAPRRYSLTNPEDIFSQSIVENTSLATSNDILDIQIRIAFIEFFSSPELLGGFKTFLKIIRLFNRPVVTIKKEAFLESIFQHHHHSSDRCKDDDLEKLIFVRRLLNTQAVEYLGEWIIESRNCQLLSKIESDSVSIRSIGDKGVWYSDRLESISYKLKIESTDNEEIGKSINGDHVNNHNDIETYNETKERKLSDPEEGIDFQNKLLSYFNGCPSSFNVDMSMPYDVNNNLSSLVQSEQSTQVLSSQQPSNSSSTSSPIFIDSNNQGSNEFSLHLSIQSNESCHDIEKTVHRNDKASSQLKKGSNNNNTFSYDDDTMYMTDIENTSIELSYNNNDIHKTSSDSTFSHQHPINSTRDHKSRTRMGGFFPKGKLYMNLIS